MTRLLLAAALLVGWANYALAVPCWDSLDAAMAAPGGHVAWQHRQGHREYFKGHRGDHVKCDEPERKVMRSEAEERRQRQQSDSRPRPAEPPAGAEPPVSRYTAPSTAYLRSWDTRTPILWTDKPRARAPLPSTTGSAPRRIERVMAAAQPVFTEARLGGGVIAFLGLIFAFAHPIARRVIR